MKKIQVGLVGCGTIGKGVIDIFNRNHSVLKTRSDLDIRIHTVCDIDQKLLRSLKGSFLRTCHVEDIFGNPEIDIVIELVGGTTVARTIVETALKSGKNVVTANKALLAKYWAPLFRVADQKGKDLFFEAAVGGGIPVIKSLREGLIANRITRIVGILNGTCNYILTSMTDESVEFGTCLSKAQAEGYAEADPTFDINGNDTAHKIYILALLGYNVTARFKDVLIEGITRITSFDIQMARELGYRIKLLAFAEKAGEKINLRVHPSMVHSDSALANISGVENAVIIEGDFIHRIMLTGPGAGRQPTASAVVSDIVDIAKNIQAGRTGYLSRVIHRKKTTGNIRVNPSSEYRSKYYLRCTTIDKPGVLSKITGILGKNHISINTCVQKGEHLSSRVPIIMMTHTCVEKNLHKALREIDRLPVVKEKSFIIRIY